MLKAHFISSNCESFPKQEMIFKGLQYKSFENIGEKGEIAYNEQFFLLPQCFLPVLRIFCNFHQI